MFWLLLQRKISSSTGRNRPALRRGNWPELVKLQGENGLTFWLLIPRGQPCGDDLHLVRPVVRHSARAWIGCFVVRLTRPGIEEPKSLRSHRSDLIIGSTCCCKIADLENVMFITIDVNSTEMRYALAWRRRTIVHESAVSTSWAAELSDPEPRCCQNWPYQHSILASGGWERDTTRLLWPWWFRRATVEHLTAWVSYKSSRAAALGYSTVPTHNQKSSESPSYSNNM